VRRETKAAWKWQDGVFDRLLRRDESAESKWIYMREDPVRAGLVRRSVQGRDHLLSLNAGPLADASEWLEHYRRFWEDRLAALEKLVTSRKRKRK